MKEIYAWVPWFQALTKKIAEGGEADLAARAKAVEWEAGGSNLISSGQNLDPLSFIYYLASRNNAPEPKRSRVYQSVSDVFEIGNGIVASEKIIAHAHVFPTPPAVATSFHGGEKSSLGLLWKLFRQAANGSRAVASDTFIDALNIPKVGVAKLTQCLFLINPTDFMPVDKVTLEFHAGLDLPNKDYAKSKIGQQQNGWENYQAMLKQFNSVFRECSFYEINTALYKMREWKKARTPIAAQCFQVSTNVYNEGDDHWPDFSSENHVRTGGPGRKYHLADPSEGDIVLVRYGTLNGRAIGIVYKNDYADGWAPEKAVHVLWLNKFSAKLNGQTGRLGFSHAKEGTFRSFYDTAQYKNTFTLLKGLRDQEPGNGDDPINGDATDEVKNMPLNQIFYGPPGTGKTYHTVNAALKILDNKFYRENRANRAVLKERFDELKEDGRIGVVTFHQSFGYEEFVEGIRPMMDDEASDEGEKVSYEIKSGIFKDMCERSVDAESADRFDVAIEKLANECTEQSIEIPTVKRKSPLILRHIPDDVFQIRSKVGGANGRPYAISVRRLKKWYGTPTEQKWVKVHAILNYLRTRHGLSKNQPGKEARVLIIDEINRGNISRIFGELITLIEESKRLGNEEATSVELPYSGDSFGVPNNLYIIGTMNTADRSIALLDTALRRRFRFVEMMPDASTMKDDADKPIEIDGVQIQTLLTKINERIEALYDRDHQIGHSYFLRLKKSPNIETLASIFQFEVLPLLQEYFYDDWEKINLVLNNNQFIQHTPPPAELTDAVADGKKIWSINAKVFKVPAGTSEHYRAIYDNAARDRLNNKGDGNTTDG